MKSLFLLTFIFLCFTVHATTYYFSASGSDANNGTSTSTSWKTITKFNSVFASKSAGDNFLFNRGDVFYGTLLISRSGASASPITIGAYGTGAMPVITGLTAVNAWTNLGSNIWESTNAASTLSYTKMVLINGVNTAMGRTPNTGSYYYYQSHSGLTQITSSSLNSSSINWTGAELVMNITTARVVRNKVTSESGSQLNYIVDPEGAGFQNDNQRFIFQNDPRTLDVQNEWYYNPSTKKIRIYSTGTPTGVQVATLDSIAVITGQSFITFDGISFQGANTSSIQINHSPNITIQNCDFNFSGRNAIFGSKSGSSNNILVQNCTINHINDNGIDLPRTDFLTPVIRLNTIKNCGVMYGMMDVNDGINNNSTAQAVSASGTNALIEYNTIDSIGFIGIHFFGSGTTIQFNYIQDYCMLNNDGGAIYSWNGVGSQSTQSNIRILHNITVNKNTSSSVNTADYGLYCDDLVNNVEAGYNTFISSGWGIELHNSFNMTIHDNTTFNNSMASIVITTDSAAGSIAGHTHMDNIKLHNNIWFANTTGQKTLWRYPKTDSIAEPIIPVNWSSDSNYYARPIDANGASILTNYNPKGRTQVLTNWVSPGWKVYEGGDSHSGTTPINLTSVNDQIIVYNATNSAVTTSLPYKYVDVRNVSYNGSITLQPFTSAVLLKSGAKTGNLSPIANAGTNQSITLPTNNISLSGSGTDADGTISSYNWAMISGPASGTLTTAATATTTVTGLVQGVYQFQLKVTDNNAATGLDTVQITVNAANIAPTANAGANQSITLPTNTILLNGNGTDADGTISSYNWTKTSGPSGGAITTATSASTTITTLGQGVYQYQLKVTDNKGATGLSSVQITVNAAANMPPTANAGTNQAITLPVSAVSLSGNGTDADGTISAYSWTKISGPASGTITNANTASTTVTAMAQGVYQYQLTVTDNSGATALSTVQVTVNGAANIPPTSNAGTNQAITLPVSAVSLSGSGTDADGTISAYSWTKISGPASGTITNANTASTTVTAMAQGVYQYQLTVTDNSGATALSTVQVTVNGAANIPPTANAGTNQAITLPVSAVSLSGSGTDADGTISAYSWTKISGPASGTITNANTASTTITAMAQGVYQYQLTVTDNSGATALSTVQITVNAANIPPTANAGTNQAITLPVSAVSLSGSGTDADGTISAYSWTKISGPASGTITNANTASTTITAMAQGVYQYQLTVTDNSGATALSTVQVTVNGAANIPPTANAGTNLAITLPVSAVSLSGSGTDADGTISAYSWTKISGPASGTITSASSALTTVTALAQGVYQFQLKVTDNKSATGLDTVIVTVNATGSLLPAVNPANTVNGIDYKYYESGGGWSVLPNFSTSTAVKTGSTTNFNISLANRSITFAFSFTGFITVPSDGQYTFYTTSDDGSNLYIDNVLVVNNDGTHGSTEKSGTIGLKAGKHAISVGYFQQGGGSVLNVNYSGPGISKTAVPASALYRISTSGLVATDNNNEVILSSAGAAIKAYPNPFSSYVEINIANGVAGEYKLMLVDASGKIIWTKRGIKSSGAFEQSINTSTLERGIYFLTLIQANSNSVIKLVKGN